MFTTTLSEIKWNKKFLKNIENIAKRKEVKHFLTNEANKVYRKLLPILPNNQNIRYYKDKGLKQSLKMGKIKENFKKPNDKSISLNVGLFPRKQRFYYVLAGRRKLRNGSYVSYKYSDTNAKAKPFPKVFNKPAKQNFQAKFKTLFNQLIEETNNE